MNSGLTARIGAHFNNNFVTKFIKFYLANIYIHISFVVKLNSLPSPSAHHPLRRKKGFNIISYAVRSIT